MRIELDPGWQLGGLVEIHLGTRHRLLNQVGEAGDEGGIDVEGRHPQEVAHPGLGGDLAIFDVDLLKGLDVFAHEADRHHHQILHPSLAQFVERVLGVGL